MRDVPGSMHRRYSSSSGPV